MAKRTKDQLVEDLSVLSVLELSELKGLLEDKWGVKAAAAGPAMVAMPAGGAAGGEAAEEATDFEVTLAEFPADKKIGIIKIIREITGLGLKEAKTMVEDAPQVVKASAPKTEADEIQKKLQDAGAKVNLKGL